MLRVTMIQLTVNFYGAGHDPAAIIANLERDGLVFIRAGWEL